MRYTFGTINIEYAGHLATISSADDGPIYMVNFMRYKDVADYGDGVDSGISGREADDKYAPVDVLDKLGATVAYFGDAVDPVGVDDEVWHRMAIVRYPTRRSFIEMQDRRDFQDKAIHMEAGMDFTVILGSLPSELVIGEPDGSGIVTFLAIPDGVHVEVPPTATASFDVEGVVIGDDRRFAQLVVTWSDVDLEALPDGVMAVRSRPFIDEIVTEVTKSLSA